MNTTELRRLLARYVADNIGNAPQWRYRRDVLLTGEHEDAWFAEFECEADAALAAAAVNALPGLLDAVDEARLLAVWVARTGADRTVLTEKAEAYLEKHGGGE